MKVVLLHGCWPYFREGAYLASVYGNVYLDLSYAIPFLSMGEMTAMTRAALAVAPFTKLMYSSDGARVPELRLLHMVRNSLLQDPGERLLMHNLRFWRTYWASRPARHHTMIPHDDLLAALEAHDAEGAENAMREHLAASRQLLHSLF